MLLFADHLSRAFLPNQEEQGEEFQVFGLEIQAFNPFDALSVSRERLAQLQKQLSKNQSANSENHSISRMARTETRCLFKSENTEPADKTFPYTMTYCLRANASSSRGYLDQKSSPEAIKVTLALKHA